MKYPHIKQHDEKDCGAACLCMISEYHGLKIPIAKARSLIKVDNIGANVYGLVDGAQTERISPADKDLQLPEL